MNSDSLQNRIDEDITRSISREALQRVLDMEELESTAATEDSPEENMDHRDTLVLQVNMPMPPMPGTP